MLFLIGLGFGVLQTVCLFWSFFLPLEVPLKLPSFFFFLLFLFAGCVFTIMSTCILLFLFFLDEFKSHYLSKKKQKKRYVVVSQWTMLIENHICKNTNDMLDLLSVSSHYIRVVNILEAYIVLRGLVSGMPLANSSNISM